MEYKKSGNDIMVKLDVGEEIVDALTTLARKENIKSALLTGIGATNDVEFGLFSSKEKKYHLRRSHKDNEITNITGNITRKKDEPYLHIHATLVDIDGNVQGGHLNKAIISVTAEIFIRIIDMDIGREMNDIGINLIKF